MFNRMVHFQVHRVYPAVKTPNGQKMYLPREFEWHYQDEQGITFIFTHKVVVILNLVWLRVM